MFILLLWQITRLIQAEKQEIIDDSTCNNFAIKFVTFFIFKTNMSTF